MKQMEIKLIKNPRFSIIIIFDIIICKKLMNKICKLNAQYFLQGHVYIIEGVVVRRNVNSSQVSTRSNKSGAK